MPEVAANIAPSDGVSNADIRFAGFEVEGAAAIVRFDLYQGDLRVGSFRFPVQPDEGSSIEGMIAKAHEGMNDALRQMLYRNEVLRQVYEKQAADLKNLRRKS